MFPFDSLRYHYTRRRLLREAVAGLPEASAEERATMHRLREAFRRTPVNALHGLKGTEADWAEAMNRLRELALTADPRAFQRWDVIAARMAHTSSPATPVELAALQAHPDWSARWRQAIHEVPAGRPVSYAGWPESSETLIQTVHNVMQLERLTERRVDSWDSIAEFGGGFGGLCRVLHVLGFRGRYLIYDLPPITLLQRYYLDRVGIGVGAGEGARLCITSDIAELDRFTDQTSPAVPALFLATWSLSEAPIALRERMKPLAERLSHSFLGFQGRYGEVDNTEYFANHWIKGTARIDRIAHRPDDYYLATLPRR